MVRISGQVELVEAPIVLTPGKAWGAAVGGLVGAAIASGETNAPDYYAKFLKDNNIDVKTIVFDSTKNHLIESRPDLKITDDKNAPEMRISIVRYGVVASSAFSGSVQPFLNVKLELVSNGSVIWAARVQNRKDAVFEMPYDDFLKNPESLQNNYKLVADQVLNKLMQHLNVQMPPKPQ